MKTIHLVENPSATQTLCGKMRMNLDTKTQLWSTVTNWPTLTSEGLSPGYEACSPCVMALEKARA